MEICAGCTRGLTSIFCTTSWRSALLFRSCRFSLTSFSFFYSLNKIVFFKTVITFYSELIKKNFELLDREAVNILWYFDVCITGAWSFTWSLSWLRLLSFICATRSLELFICFESLAVLHLILLDVSVILSSL